MLDRAFDVDIDRVMFVDEAIEKMQSNAYALAMVNRLIFDDSSEGIELIRRAKADSSLHTVPIMMISNYEDAQARAMEAGAVRGFGKAEIGKSPVIELLAKYLPRKGAATASV